MGQELLHWCCYFGPWLRPVWSWPELTETAACGWASDRPALPTAVRSHLQKWNGSWTAWTSPCQQGTASLWSLSSAETCACTRAHPHLYRVRVCAHTHNTHTHTYNHLVCQPASCYVTGSNHQPWYHIKHPALWQWLLHHIYIVGELIHTHTHTCI